MKNNDAPSVANAHEKGQTQGVAAVAGLFGDSERNWSEDFKHENGSYGHVCRDCGQSFVGHKRRPNQCRKCTLVAKEKWYAQTPEQQFKEEKAMLAWLKAYSPNA